MKYFKQETYYSCGASALRNCLKHYSINISEKRIRRILGTQKDGTSENQLVCGAEYYGFEVKEIECKSVEYFRKKLNNSLKSGVVIMLVDNEQHWIPILEYSNRKYKIIDSIFKELKNKSISQWINPKELLQRAKNIKVTENKYHYYFIALKINNE